MPELKNYMEICVSDIIDDLLKRLNVCRCENCKLDVMAIVLNNLPPKYVVTRKGQLYTKLNSLRQQFEVDIVSEVVKASAIVSKGPRHSAGI